MKLALLILSSFLLILDFIEFMSSPVGIMAGIGLTYHYYWLALKNFP